ncbi:NADPH:quinone reductase [Rhodoferax koreense]|uniref:Zinc-type alcohol dehydrogenase-like protein n=1 Tax=Rhodoferax koreensis TaxID=1842727 RepID=A0A1P8JS57_9BURK|nr:zinc-binding alcohol dehydrogenase family protein [Rhodoferax koreense]APW36594.1 NADPH:quinone reductase [Rhodoferax koreense]
MKAVAYFNPLPITDEASLQDVDLPTPTVGARDLLVRVAAVSVNPVDTKVRASARPEAGQAKVLGWDAVGTVEAVGAAVSFFKPGDRVYYAGSITRPGTNAELHAVDERIVGLAPTRLSDTEAAALPLTAITAWELLFDRLQVPQRAPDAAHGSGQTLLVIGGAGGVGSILLQLARQRTDLKIIATASRPETRQWCLDLGAHLVIDHSQPLAAQLLALGIPAVDMVASLTQTDQHFAAAVEVLRPQGRLALIDDPKHLDVTLLKRKCISLHWEFMFARAMFETPDMGRQRELLNAVAALVDAGVLKTTVQADLGTINAANLRRAHALIESGRTQGKLVLKGF